MITQRIRLAGSFVEAFLYFDFLWLLNADGEIWAFDTAAYLTDKVKSDPNAALMAFARNDRLPRNQHDRVEQAFQQHLTHSIGAQGLDLTEAEVQRFSRVFKGGRAPAKSILDFRCYYGRGFIATDTSVLQLRMLGRSDLQHVHLGGRGNGALGGDKVADFRCRQLRTNLGLISAAAGPNGAWYASGGLSDDPEWRAAFVKFAEKSNATEVMDGAMINVASADELSVFDTEIHPIESRSQYAAIEDDQVRPAQEITKVLGDRSDVTTPLRSALRRIQEADRRTFKRTFLSKSKVFAVDDKDQIHTLRLDQENRLQPLTPSSRFPATPGRILSITFTANGKTVAELDDEVCLLDFPRKRWETVFQGEVYSIRGYPGSRWYQNLLTCVGEDSVELTFVI